MQKQLLCCGDPAIYTDASITEPVFIICQEYKTLNNSDNTITDPPRLKDVREFLQKDQLIHDTTDTQKHGAAEVAAVLSEVKPKVCQFFSCIVQFSFMSCFYLVHTHSASVHLQDHQVQGHYQ